MFGVVVVVVCGVVFVVLSLMMWLGIDDGDGVWFYVGEVVYVWLKLVRREFKYFLRCAVVDLDASSRWFAVSG